MRYVQRIYPQKMAEDPAGRSRNRPWSYEEVVLACELVASNGWRYLSRRDKRTRELSELLRTMYPREAARSADFRNVDGVSRKTADIATRHPEYRGKPTKGGRHELPVLLAFLNEPNLMAELAQTIRARGSSVAFPVRSEVLDLEPGEPKTTGHETTPRRGGQSGGRQEDTELRLAVERYAVRTTVMLYTEAGYEVDDVGAYKPWDLTARSTAEEIHIEVKGSIGLRDEIDLTEGEVRSAEGYQPTDLVVVDGIKWTRSSAGVECTAGRVRRWRRWTPSRSVLAATSYRYPLPQQEAE